MFILFVGPEKDPNPASFVEYMGWSVKGSYSSMDEAKKAFTNEAYGIIGVITFDGWQVHIQTVSLFNMGVGHKPIYDQWVDVRSS